MQQEIPVWGPNDTETVTILASGKPGVYRIIWHRNGHSVEFEIQPGDDELGATLTRELRQRRG